VPLRPRLGLAPLLLILAIAAVAVVLATRPGGTPRLQTQPPGSSGPASPAVTAPPGGQGDNGSAGSSAPAGGQGPNGSSAGGGAGGIGGGQKTGGAGGASLGGLLGGIGGAPSSPSAPPAQPAAGWTHTDGPTCSGMTRDGTWNKINGSATAGCTDGYWHKQIGGGQGDADWVFSPGKGKSCTFTIYIADSTTITATRAEYQLYDDPKSHTHLLMPQQYLNQAAHRGSTMTLTPPATTTGTYDLQIYDFAADGTDEYAGVVTLTCI
jgi:hypothetical protein